MITVLKNLDATSRNVLLILVGVALVTSVSSSLIGNTEASSWWEGWLQNFSTEVFGAVMTFILFEQIIGKRQDQQEKSQAQDTLKQRLTRQMGSQESSVALPAVEELRAHGWLMDGSLQQISLVGAQLKDSNLGGANFAGAILRRADLSDVNLGDANLQGAILTGANLSGSRLDFANLSEADLEGAQLQDTALVRTIMPRAKLTGANLQQANLEGTVLTHANLMDADLTDARLLGADLQHADLRGVTLTGAKLWGTQLDGADLSHANLKGAYLRRATLIGAVLTNAQFDETTILPDDTNWTPDTNMTQFTETKNENE